MHPAVIGVVEDDHVTGMQVIAVVTLERFHRIRYGAEMQRHGFRLRQDSSLGVTHCRGVIEHVPDDGRARCAHHRIGHVVDDGLKRALEHREGNRIELRVVLGIVGLGHDGDIP
jgi:hypothetical protein